MTNDNTEQQIANLRAELQSLAHEVQRQLNQRPTEPEAHNDAVTAPDPRWAAIFFTVGLIVGILV